MKILTYAVELLILTVAFWLGNRLWWHKYSGIKKALALALAGCAVLMALAASNAAKPSRMVTVSALGKANPAADWTELTISHFKVNGETVKTFSPESGKWTLYEGQYRWFVPGDERAAEDTTDSISFTFDLADQVEIVFWGNQWKGIAQVDVNGRSYHVDTYRAGSEAVSFSLPQLTAAEAARSVLMQAGVLAAVLILICLFGFIASLLGEMVWRKLSRYSHIQKLQKYQFLFEELVKRDFKKKYKRTVLGMAWSVLSPLLILLVMRLVFSQFFGRNTAHYTIYLFCGNLIFSYFNESTSQGMISLMGNAGIFTKVNVPKYLFLFSKNVQTLINFGLTLCVFFLFCVLDNITFTWKFICLLYPVCCLVLFNIGVGLILSALFVFFRDIQYLWSVFTMLLMYMSAIFYTIDSYSYEVQCLFLINPVYLFIRYFRKIVIEAAIPTAWFHLLMLADVFIVLGLGCWMYKKYNHKFLYYV